MFLNVRNHLLDWKMVQRLNKMDQRRIRCQISKRNIKILWYLDKTFLFVKSIYWKINFKIQYLSICMSDMKRSVTLNAIVDQTIKSQYWIAWLYQTSELYVSFVQNSRQTHSTNELRNKVSKHIRTYFHCLNGEVYSFTQCLQL